MTNAPEPFDLSAELDETDDWDDLDEPTGTASDPWQDEDPEETIGSMELAERHALRRVAGLSTELEDISEVEYRKLRLERVVLVGVWTEGTVEDAENSMAELALAWVLRRDEVASAIVGASRPEQVHANAAAAGIELTADTIAAADEVLAGVAVVGQTPGPGVREGVTHR